MANEPISGLMSSMINLEDANRLISEFLSTDEYYLDSAAVYGDRGKEKIGDALMLFLMHPSAGGVWLSYIDGKAVAVCIFSFAISTSLGGWVAKLDDVFVADGYRGQNIGTKHIESLKSYLRKCNVRRIDTSVHMRNGDAKRFYEKVGFKSLNEEKLSCLL